MAASVRDDDSIALRTACLMPAVNSFGSESLGVYWYLVTGRNFLAQQTLANLRSSTVLPTPRSPYSTMLFTLPRATLRNMSSNARSSFSRPAKYGGSRPDPGVKGLVRSLTFGPRPACPITTLAEGDRTFPRRPGACYPPRAPARLPGSKEGTGLAPAPARLGGTPRRPVR